MSFAEVPIKDLQLNPFNVVGEEWLLITAGNRENGYNTMTASWGHLGVVWGLPTAVVYIRPQRYTKEFVDREEIFTLSALGKGYRKELGYLGSHSGRDEDKIAATGLTPVSDQGTTYFAEAEMVFICRKLYHAPLLESGFMDATVMSGMYPEKDYHEVFVGEIVKVLRAERK